MRRRHGVADDGERTAGVAPAGGGTRAREHEQARQRERRDRQSTGSDRQQLPTPDRPVDRRAGNGRSDAGARGDELVNHAVAHTAIAQVECLAGRAGDVPPLERSLLHDIRPRKEHEVPETFPSGV